MSEQPERFATSEVAGVLPRCREHSCTSTEIVRHGAHFYCERHRPLTTDDVGRSARNKPRMADYSRDVSVYVHRLLNTLEDNPRDGSWGDVIVAELHTKYQCPRWCDGSERHRNRVHTTAYQQESLPDD